MEDAMVVYRLCLTGDTRIRTDKGWKYITDVKIGDIVYCQTSPGIFAKVPVIWWVNNGIQKILKLKTQHTEIRGTLTHPLLVNRNGVVQWVDLQDIKPKQDKLLNVTHDIEVPVAIPKVDGTVYMLRRKYAAEVVNQEKLEKCVKHIVGKSNIDPIKVARNVTLFLKGLNRYGVRKNWLDKISSVFAISEGMVIKTKRKSRTINLPEFVDEDFARFFGFMLGDGSIRRSGHSMCFAASPDANLNKHYSGLMLRYFGSVNFDKEKRSKHIECGNYTVGSTEAVNIMLEMGYICKNKRIPQWVFNAPKNIRRAFVEGISDADGCERFTKAGTWFSTISMSNKELINDIKEVWHGIGLCSGKIKERVRKASYRKSWNRHLPETTTYEITITDRILPTYDTVWSVVPDGEEEVYDFTVDHEGHNFVANGICSMNTRAPERRVFYIDVGQLPPYKAEAFMERLKDLFRKKKVASSTARTQSGAASSVEERWHAPAADEDYWLPIRPNSNTRIDTLPGAQNLGEIDDAVYFRNKLFTALNFPKNYFSSEDVQVTRIALSAQDVRFARQVERLQSHIEDGLWQIADRHLKLRGFPEEAYEDLLIKMTPPSDWRELSRAEVLTNRINNANGLKGSMLWSDYDILTKMMKIPEDEAKGMMSRLKMQKLEDLKLQVLAQNPQLLGVGVPGEGENEVGAESGGPNQMIAPDQAQGPAPEQPQVAASDQGPPAPPEQQQPNAAPLADFTTDELKKYDLQVQTYSLEADREEVDFSQQG
jgi:intein/homing endonuclease